VLSVRSDDLTGRPNITRAMG